MTYISWFSGLYLEDYFMYKAVTLAGGIREPLLTCSSFFYYGLKNELEIAVVNEPSVFEPPKFYCI